MTQLALDLTGNQDRVLDLSERCRVELTMRARVDEVILEAVAGSGRTCMVRWTFAPKAQLQVEGHLRVNWWMVDAPTWAVPRRTNDVLDSVTDWVWREANGWHAGTRERTHRKFSRRCRGPLHAQLRDLQRALLARCIPHARDAAARFRPSTRFEVYRWFESDPTGRVAQLAVTMPGLVLWSLAMRGLGLDAAVEEATRSIVSGARPRVVLGELLESWRSAYEPHLDNRAIAWRRALVERASAWVDPVHLLLPSFVPVHEDIPRQRVAAACWYRIVMRILSGAQNEAIEIAPFVSRHALGLDQAVASSQHDEAALGQLGGHLATLARLRGRPLRRDHGVATTIEAARHAVELEELARCGDTTRFPTPPLRDRDDRDVQIAALTDVDQLIGEAVRMRHCVAYLAAEIVAGRSAVYHAQVSGESLTVHLANTGDCWCLAEIAGTANRTPSRQGYREVLRWLVDELAEAA